MPYLLKSIAVLVALLVAGQAPVASAQQPTAVVYRALPRSASDSEVFDPPITAIRLEVVSWEDGRLVGRSDGSPIESISQAIPDSQIVGIEVTWEIELAKAANQAFSEGRWRDSILAAQEAINTPGMPLWQQKLLGLQIVSAAMQYERIDVAVQVYTMLDQRRLPQLALGYLPVPWGGEAPIERMLRDLDQFAQSPDEATKFIVAAWRLTGPERESAKQAMQAITSGESPLLRKLAQAQLWRIEPPEAFRRHLPESLELRDSLPLSLQAGVNAVIADRLERGGELELAHSMWVSVAIDSHPHRLPVAPLAAARLDALAERGVGAQHWPQLRDLLLRQ